ncbi:MAG TPA: methionyl-tRNA formyltransferase [Terriglobales bacterium]|jgi:methionyl-tRNA formyltransferase|nr:methionyl-tRNA formyltransferase [Terriglobales bacterium]
MSAKLKLVFAGTPRFAVPTLEKLAEMGHRIAFVLTQPDKARGRGMEITPSPVKEAAQQLGIPIQQPETIKNNVELREALTRLAPDAIIVVGYGRIIPQWMIDLPQFGNINLHASLLPKYRGAAPIQWAIARGETTTGVTTMRIDAGLDTGDILLQKQVAIEEKDTAETLGPKLANQGADLMVETLGGLIEGAITPRAQNHADASLAPILKKEDGIVDFTRSAKEIVDRLRGFQPWPGATTVFRGKGMKITQARVAEETISEMSNPGTLGVRPGRLYVHSGARTALEIIEVQPEGKKRMSVSDFIHGYRPSSGESLGR